MVDIESMSDQEYINHLEVQNILLEGERDEARRLKVPPTVDELLMAQMEASTARTEIEQLKARLAQVDMKRPFLAVDIICLVPQGLVLVERKWPPFGWALPGGHVEYGESCEDAAIREMKEETGLDITLFDLICVNSKPDRDPRKHTVSVSYLATAQGTPVAADDAKNIMIVPSFSELPEMAFDHKEIITKCLKHAFMRTEGFNK